MCACACCTCKIAYSYRYRRIVIPPRSLSAHYPDLTSTCRGGREKRG
ncbi:hypothetical protein CaCOL14_003616 [Colletotrichum acutatum]